MILELEDLWNDRKNASRDTWILTDWKKKINNKINKKQHFFGFLIIITYCCYDSFQGTALILYTQGDDMT